MTDEQIILVTEIFQFSKELSSCGQMNKYSSTIPILISNWFPLSLHVNNSDWIIMLISDVFIAYQYSNID